MRFRAIAALAALAIIPALAQAEDMQGMKMQRMMKMAPHKASPADQALSASMQAMMRDMKPAMSGDPDKDFVAMMLPHHQGAIDMAKVELQYGKDPAIRKMAQDIVAAQEAEIAEMKAWQAAHGK